jgi:hypothetical protein
MIYDLSSVAAESHFVEDLVLEAIGAIHSIGFRERTNASRLFYYSDEIDAAQWVPFHERTFMFYRVLFQTPIRDPGAL